MLLLIPILAAACSLCYPRILGRPRFLKDQPASLGGARISVVVPARDEEENIGGLLDSIAAQPVQPFEVIVVDDGSGDRTAEIAREKRARVISAGTLPAGWKGKPWACQQGAAAAEGEWLLFLDADVRLESDALRRFVALTEVGGAAFSVCPYHSIRRPYEELSAFFNVTMIAGINAFGSTADRPRDTALFGQCLLISRPHHEEVGGHERVRAEVLENFHLARHLRARGIRSECFLGRGAVTMRMFPGGAGELWSSWKKGFAGGAGGAPREALVATSLWISGGMLAMAGAGVAVLPLAGAGFRVAAVLAYLLYAVQCRRAFRLAGKFSAVNAAFFPVSLVFYQLLFFTSLFERKFGIKSRWKGRDVD